MTPWSLVPLGKVVTFQRGYDLPHRARKQGTVPIVSSAGVTDYHNTPQVNPPGVVTGRYGTIGEIYLVTEPFWPLNTTLYVRDFHGNDPCFVYYLLHRFDFHSFSGKSGVPGVNRNDLHLEPVTLPDDADEQRAIAAVLSDMDALLVGLERLIAKKRDLKQAAMQQLLTGQTRLPGFSGEWEMKRLGETAILKARIGWQGLTTAEYLDIGDYYLVTGTEFKNGYIDWNSCHYVDESRYRQDKYIQLKEHDVLVTKDGTIGKVALITDLPRSATLNSGVFVIRPREDAFHPEFFYYLLCSSVFTKFLAQLSAGSTINHLYQKDFVTFIYSVPATIKEQTAIAAVLSDMDAELSVLEARRDKTRALKQAMMQELLTGKTRLVPPSSNAVTSDAR
jgi:type I restriction enzyme S subunit